MEERSSLLNQLRIRRDDAPKHSEIRWQRLFVSSVLVASGLGAVAWFWLNASRAVLVSVAIAEPTPGLVSSSGASILDASGYVVARRQATVASKITGRVIELLIEEGRHIEAGEVIARLDDTNYRAVLAHARAKRDEADASLRAALVAESNAKPTFERHRQMLEKQVISAQTFEMAKSEYDLARTNVDVASRTLDVAIADLAVAQNELEDTVVRAPFAGIVTVKAAQEGEMVSPVSAGGGFTRTGIGTIVDMNSLEVQVDVSENFIDRVRPRQDVAITLNAYPHWTISGHVIAIIPTADRARATVRVRVGLGEKDDRILPEMGARVSFLAATPERSSQLQTPSAIVIAGAVYEGDQLTETGVVYVVRGNTVERTTVRITEHLPDDRVVLTGISAGTRLAVADPEGLYDGVRIRVDE